ncbi:MAG: DegT/DnrJ/EryC1/StrS family aminotransferase [Bacteroidota bacterium]
MKKIQMVDLLGQYEMIREEIDKAITNVLRSSAYIRGPEVKAFQSELEQYLGVKHVIPCGNGTDALQIALMSLDLEHGDEVITTSFTFIATAEVIALLGLKPVFVDISADTFNIDASAIEKAITNKTKAILPVHLYGQCTDMESILAIAEKHNLYVIEDTAQALGAEYKFNDGTVKKSGTMGTIGCTSFFPSKNLGCYGDGGAIFTNNDQLAEKLKMIANHGQRVRYYHDIIGVNSRLDSIQAAVLRVKLKHLDDYAKARNQAAQYYDKAFGETDGLTVPFRSPKSTHVFHQYTLKTNGIDRDGLQDYLKSKEIPAMIYYPVPLHLQKAFNQTGASASRLTTSDSSEKLPITEQLSKSVISLPIHTEMDEEQLEYITNSVLEYVKN